MKIFHLIRSDNVGVDVLLRINDIDRSLNRCSAYHSTQLTSTELRLTTLNLRKQILEINEFLFQCALSSMSKQVVEWPQWYLACRKWFVGMYTYPLGKSQPQNTHANVDWMWYCYVLVTMISDQRPLSYKISPLKRSLINRKFRYSKKGLQLMHQLSKHCPVYSAPNNPNNILIGPLKRHGKKMRLDFDERQ